MVDTPRKSQFNMSYQYPSLSYGFATFPQDKRDLERVFEVLEAHGIDEIDTARRYVDSEATLGEMGAASRFKITTKAEGWRSGALERVNLLNSAKRSLETLGVSKVHTYLLHSPDPAVSIAETMEAIQELHLAGTFDEFGLSNFTGAQVQEVYDTAKSKGYVLPTVYQGNYNLVARTNEETLFPTLRALGIRIQAYSPVAGGFLLKSTEEVAHPEEGGRWDKSRAIGSLYHKLYNRPELLDYLGRFMALAEKAGISQASLAYRWTRYHSALQDGDTLIIGASKLKQLETTLDELDKGPLEGWVVDQLEEMGKCIIGVAPADNYIAAMGP